MSQPHVSVVVSTFQRSATLRRTLDALLAQRVPDGLVYEVVVVDNNSTDATPMLVADYIGRFPGGLRYVFEPRQGVSYGRNTGIRTARGPIVAFTDDDNVVARTWVATIYELMTRHPDAAGIGGRVLPEWPRTPPLWLDRKHWSPLAILDYGERAFVTSAQRPLCLLTANLAIRRDVLLRSGGFSPEFPRCQDHELLIRLWRSGERVLYAPELVVFAPIDSERMTRRYHRRWHARHGYFAAAMRLEEATDGHGQLQGTTDGLPRLMGAPGYVYANLGTQAWKWIGATVRRQPSRAAHHEHRVRYLTAYLWRTAVLERRGGAPLVREALQFARAQFTRRAELANMSAARMLAAHAVIALLVAGSAYDIASGTEHWPFSPYPMFAHVERARTLDSLLLRGVVDDGSGREIPLREAGMIGPFDQCRLNTAMQRARSGPDGQNRLQAMLQDCLARYEAARGRGEHDGPPLEAIRVYDAHWALDPEGRNVDTPTRARLIGEVSETAPATARVNREP
jgi:GT2 family glycosyltransferase